MDSGRKSLPMSSGGSGGLRDSGSGCLRDSGSQYRSSSGGIRGIMENLSQHQDVSGQVSMLSALLILRAVRTFSSGCIRGIMENLLQFQDVSGQVCMLSTLVIASCVHSLIWMQRQFQC